MTPESITAAAKSAGKLSLTALQSKMKCDPEGYDTELQMLYKQFNSSLELFHQQSALGFNSLTGIGADPAVAKDLSDRAMFLAHMTPVYPQHLSEFPRQLAELLKSTARLLPAFLRCHIAQALILLVNRKIVDIGETLALFMELQTLGDTTLRKLAFSHVVHCIRRLNKKHKNDAKNRPLQNILFGLLQRDEELIAKRSLVTLCELHRRRVWFDEKTANAICMACFHPSSRIMVAALSFLLDYEKIQDDDDSDVSSSDEEDATQQPQVVLSREAVYKAHRQGTTSSKKKKKAKLQRVMRSMKRQQRLNSQNADSNYYSPLNHLKDAQGFVEKLFSQLQSCNERFEVKMMMMKVIARTVGLHRLILLQFYPFLQKYVQPHQRDVTNLLAAAVQACHDMVPPDAVEPLFKEVVNKFVHDRSRTEAIAVGINVVREICLRMPLLMTEELLQDLVLYKKSHEKAVSSAARSLITLFREVCPSLLVKKDRGRPVDPKARPKAFGDVNVVSNIPGAELLEEDNHEIDNSDIEGYSSEGDHDGDDVNDGASDDISMADCGSEDNEVESDGEGTEDEGASNSADDEGSADEVSADDLEDEDEEEQEVEEESSGSDESDERNEDYAEKPNSKKRVRSDFDELLNAAGKSLRALRKLTVAKMGPTTDSTDGILSNEDFRKIKELQAKKKVRTALEHHGLAKASGSKSASVKLPSSDDLSVKRVDPAKLEAHIRRKVTKDEKLALIRAGREERGKYQARTAVKKKKEGGLSNREKQRKKYMPDAAKRAKMAKTRQDKRRKHMRSGKQFRGKKAWKN